MAADPPIARVLRSYGKAIGAHPCKWFLGTLVVYLAIIIGGFSTRKGFGGSEPIMDDDDMELQWSVKGGKTEKNLKRYKLENEGNDDWTMTTSMSHFVMKDFEEGEDSNILTQEALLEMLEVHRLYMNLKVRQNAKVYSTMDLCARGMLPDGVVTGGMAMPKLPCLIISPLHCFREMGDPPMVDESYHAYDSIIANVVPGALPYFSRPSLAKSTNKEITEILAGVPNPAAEGSLGATRGCTWWTSLRPLTADYWVGKPTWQTNSSGNTIMAKAVGLRTLFMNDGPARIQFRMNFSLNPNVTSEIKQAIELHSKLWQETCLAFNKRAKYIKIANMQDMKYVNDEIEEEVGGVDGKYFLIGIIILLLFCACTLGKCTHPLASHITIGYIGFVMVILSEVLSFSCMFVVGVKLNGVIMIAIPLLGLGLGLDDLFVFLRYFSGLGLKEMMSNTPSEIIGEVMARAGPGAALTSVCNCLAFFCGFFLPVQAMSHFCLCAMFIAFCNFVTMVNLFMPLLCWEVYRIERKQADPACCPCHYPILRNATKAQQKAKAQINRQISPTSGQEVIVSEGSDVTPPESALGIGGTADSDTAIRHRGSDESGASAGEKQSVKTTLSVVLNRLSKPSVFALSSEEFTNSPERVAIKFVRQRYAPFLTKPITAGIVSILGLALLIVSIVLIQNAGVGYAPWEIFPKDSPNRDGMYHAFKTFSMFVGALCFHDLDVAMHQEDLMTLYKSFNDGKYTSGSSNFLTTFYNWEWMEAEREAAERVPKVSGWGCLDKVCTKEDPGATSNQVSWCWTAMGVGILESQGKAGLLGNPSAGLTVPDSVKGTLEGMGKWDSLIVGMNMVEQCQAVVGEKITGWDCLDGAQPCCIKQDCEKVGCLTQGCLDEVGALRNFDTRGFKMEPFAPHGLLPRDPVQFWSRFKKYRRKPLTPESAWQEENQGFMHADMSGVTSLKFTDEVLPKATFGRMDLLHINLHTELEFIEAIKEAKKLLEAAPPAIKENVFFYGTIYTFWEVFLELQDKLHVIMGIDCAIIFVITFVFFNFDIVTAIITCLSCTMIVVEIYGLSMIFLSFNIYVASTVLMAMGMSVEFTAHLAAAFSLGEGETMDRLAESMAHTFPALIEGSISTLGAILPLAFHPQVFIVKYLFGMMAMVVGLGILNGVIIMPAMLALLGPFMKYSAKKVRKSLVRQPAPDPQTGTYPSGSGTSGASGRTESNRSEGPRASPRFDETPEVAEFEIDEKTSV